MKNWIPLDQNPSYTVWKFYLNLKNKNISFKKYFYKLY